MSYIICTRRNKLIAETITHVKSHEIVNFAYVYAKNVELLQPEVGKISNLKKWEKHACYDVAKPEARAALYAKAEERASAVGLKKVPKWAKTKIYQHDDDHLSLNFLVSREIYK